MLPELSDARGVNVPIPKALRRHCRWPAPTMAMAMLASLFMSPLLAQQAHLQVGAGDDFLKLESKISRQTLEGLKATAMDPSAGAAYDVDVRNGVLAITRANTEIARGVLTEVGTARETCYGFERDDGRLREGYFLCQPLVDLVVTARPRAPDGYFASLKAGALYFKATLLDRHFGVDESVYSAAFLKPRK